MKRKVMLAGFTFAALLTAFFVVRTVFFAVHFMDPDRGLYPVEGWMTPRYISRAYDIPREDLLEILNLGADDKPRQPLKKLAAARGIPVADLIAEMEAAIAARRPQ